MPQARPLAARRSTDAASVRGAWALLVDVGVCPCAELLIRRLLSIGSGGRVSLFQSDKGGGGRRPAGRALVIMGGAAFVSGRPFLTTGGGGKTKKAFDAPKGGGVGRRLF